MGIKDDVRKYGLNALGALGGAMMDIAGTALVKAGGDAAERAPGGKDEDTVASNPVPTEKAVEDPKALLWDPFSIVEQLGYKDKPSSITYGTLKAIFYKMPIIGAVIQNRIDQLASFTTPQQDKYKLGFKIQTRDHKKAPTKAEQDWSQKAEALFMRTGVTDNPRGRNGFEEFLRKLVWDMLVYDQMCLEVVPNRKGTPAEWYAVDASTMRLADTASTHFNEDKVDAVKYVQIYDGMIIAEYTQEELCFGVRNPRTDIRLQGYGVSELEMMIPTITSLLHSQDFNQKFFSQGSAAKGIINFKGTVPEHQLQNFRKQWYTQVASVENAWRTPITNSEDLQYINLQSSARDMEFSAWMDFQIKVACAFYNMDPIELNFKYGNVGQKAALADSSNTEKITESRERGLRPLIRFIAQAFNDYIVWPMNENFEFAFVGLDAPTRDKEVDLNTKLVKSTRTVDEMRAEDDLEPLPDGKGEVILDPVWLQNAQGLQAAAEGGLGEEVDGEEAGGEGGDDYEKMLRQYEDDEEEETEEEEMTDKERKAKAANTPAKVGDNLAKKSLTKSWVVNL